MIKELIVTNSYNESMSFGLTNPEETGYAIANIAGLEPTNVDIKTTQLATGTRYIYSAGFHKYRTIQISMVFVEQNNALKDIPDLREDLYKLFKGNDLVRLTFKESNPYNELIYSIDGYISITNTPIFSKQCGAEISVICPDPWFFISEYNQTTGRYERKMFEKTMRYVHDTSVTPAKSYYTTGGVYKFNEVLMPFTTSGSLKGNFLFISNGTLYNELEITQSDDGTLEMIYHNHRVSKSVDTPGSNHYWYNEKGEQVSYDNSPFTVIEALDKIPDNLVVWFNLNTTEWQGETYYPGTFRTGITMRITSEAKAWTINENPDVSSETNIFDTPFTCDGARYNLMYVISNSYNPYIDYGDEDGERTTVYENGEWVAEKYRSVVFDEPLNPNSPIGQWFNANAQPVRYRFPSGSYSIEIANNAGDSHINMYVPNPGVGAGESLIVSTERENISAVLVAGEIETNKIGWLDISDLDYRKNFPMLRNGPNSIKLNLPNSVQSEPDMDVSVMYTILYSGGGTR